MSTVPMQDPSKSPAQRVLERIVSERFTGLLRVSSREANAEFWFLAGILVDGRFGASKGDEALERLLRATQLRFETELRLPSLNGDFKKPMPASGSFAEFLPVALMRYCESNALTCSLELRGKDRTVRVTYRTGELLSADAAAADNSALPALLESQEGSYEFSLPVFELPEDVNAIATSAPKLLLAERIDRALADESAAEAETRALAEQSAKEAKRDAAAAAAADAKRKADEAANAEAKRRTDEARREADAAAAARRKADEARREAAAAAAAKQKADEARREAEAAAAAKRRAAEAQRQADAAAAAETKRRADEAANADTKRRADEEARREADAAAAAKREADEARRKADEAADAKREADETVAADAKRKADEATNVETKRKTDELEGVKAKHDTEPAGAAWPEPAKKALEPSAKPRARQSERRGSKQAAIVRPKRGRPWLWLVLALLVVGVLAYFARAQLGLG